MDAFDRKILQVIQQEPGISMQDLAGRVGLSHTPCWRRLKKLEETGVISGRAVILDPARIGLPINVFAQVRMKFHDESTLEAFETAAHDRPEIVECFTMSGEADFLLRIVMPSIADYEQFLKKTLLHMPGVGSVNSGFALKCVKMTTVLPI